MKVQNQNGPDFANAWTLDKQEKSANKKIAWYRPVIATGQVICILFILFIYLCALNNLSLAFTLLSSRGLGKAVQQSPLLNDPISAVIVGMLATVILQNATTTISVLVGMVAADMITVHDAIPVMLGSDLGSSVVNTLVSLAYSGDDEQFARAFSAATLADVFNVCCLFAFLPIELLFGVIENLSWFIVDPLIAEQGIQFKTMDLLTDPINQRILQVNEDELRNATIYEDMFPPNHTFVKRCEFQNGTRIFNCPYQHIFAYSSLSDYCIGWIVLVISVVTLICCLVGIVYLIQKLLSGKTGERLNKLMGQRFPGVWRRFTGYTVMLAGCLLTLLIQSNSIFTTSLTPLVGSGIINLKEMYPLILGSNIGATFSGVLAALSADGSRFEKTLHMAVCQVIYNILGTFAFYVIPQTRRMPINIATALGRTTAKYRWFIVVFLLVFFIILPAVIIGLSLLPPIVIILVFSCIFLSVLCCVGVKIGNTCCPQMMPNALKSFEWIPIWFRSLEPYDPWCTKMFTSIPIVGSFFEKRRPNDLERDSYQVTQLQSLSKQTEV